MNSFNSCQHSCEVVLAYVDGLMDQGLGRGRALDHAAHKFGADRAKVAKLLNERDYGVSGNSGETEYSAVANPQGLMGTSDDRDDG